MKDSVHSMYGHVDNTHIRTHARTHIHRRPVGNPRPMLAAKQPMWELRASEWADKVGRGEGP